MHYKDLSNAQRKRFLITVIAYLVIGIGVLSFFTGSLYSEKKDVTDSWDKYLTDSDENKKLIAELGADSTVVSVGTYVENLREINLKSSNYRVEFLAWFNWEGDPELNPSESFRVYKGIVNKKQLIKDYHEGGKNYQLLRMDVTVSKGFDTRRFPLESHQIRFYIECEKPIQEMRFVADKENSGLNRNISITGYEFLRYGIGDSSFKYSSTHGDPELKDFEMSSEVVTSFEISRAGYGLYVKCFIALFGTITWCLIALFLCTYHRVDPLGMIPGALFGTVSNIMVGASLVPDALEMGLLEYVNFWGILTILGVTIAIININRIRNKYEDKEFAHYLGTALFYIVVVFTLVGNIMLPMTAYF